MRYLFVPFLIFVITFAILQFRKELELNKGKTWVQILKNLGIAVGAGVLTAIVMFVIIVLFN